MNSSGARIGNETLTFVRADQTIRPLRDQIIVEPLPWGASAVIEAPHTFKTTRGVVRAAGPGRWLLQYARGSADGKSLTWYPTHSPPSKGQRCASRESKIFRPCDLKIGDIVDLGGLEIGGYLHGTFRWGDKEVVMCREEDVCIVREAA